MIVISIIPVYFANRLTREEGVGARPGAGGERRRGAEATAVP